MEVHFKQVLQKFKLLNHSRWTDEVFGTGKHKMKDKIWGTTVGGSPQTGPPKFKLLTTRAPQM